MVERGAGSGDDFDSSEMAAMSSSELKDYKMKQLLQEEKLESARVSAILKTASNLVVKVEEEKKVEGGKSKAAVPVPAKAAAPAAAAPVAFPDAKASVVDKFLTPEEDDGRLANFSAGSSGFDIGLLIAFPVIIGTLALFFVFPFVGEKLAGGSGPLPPM